MGEPSFSAFTAGVPRRLAAFGEGRKAAKGGVGSGDCRDGCTYTPERSRGSPRDVAAGRMSGPSSTSDGAASAAEASTLPSRLQDETTAGVGHSLLLNARSGSGRALALRHPRLGQAPGSLVLLELQTPRIGGTSARCEGAVPAVQEALGNAGMSGRGTARHDGFIEHHPVRMQAAAAAKIAARGAGPQEEHGAGEFFPAHRRSPRRP